MFHKVIQKIKVAQVFKTQCSTILYCLKSEANKIQHHDLFIATPMP